MSRVLVTGATGFLGQQVVARLTGFGIPVLATGRNPDRCAALGEAGHLVIRHDLAEPLDAASCPALAEVDRIIHCAALSAPFGRLSDFWRANVTATRNLVEFAHRQGVSRFVHISTPSVYFAFRDQTGVRETAPLPPPVNHYVRTKREAEEIVRAASGIGPVILRPRGIYGAGDTTLLPRLLTAAKRGPLPLFRHGTARIDLTHVEDVANAAIAALSAEDYVDGEIYNISGGTTLPVRDIAEQACSRAGIAVRWRAMPLAPAMMAAGAMETAAMFLPGRPEPPVTRYGLGLFAYAQSLDITKAKNSLGWKPEIDFEEGLDRTFAGLDAP